MPNKSSAKVMVFDIGTQSTRALIFDISGNLLWKTQTKSSVYIAETDFVAEKSCDAYWEEMCAVSQELKTLAGDEWKNIVAVSVTSIRNSLMFLDEYCNQTRDAILWLDKREVQCKKKLPLLNSILFTLVGMSESCRVIRKTSSTNWVRENQPDIWAKTAKIVMPSAYFNFRLTGELKDSTASQAAKIPYDYKHKRWQTKHSLNYPIFGVEIEKMCDLVNPGDKIGSITQAAANDTGLPVGIAVIATGADKMCETLGSGSAKENLASISLGTAASVEITTKKYVEPENFMPAYTSLMPNMYSPEIQIFRGYWMISWYKNEFAKIFQNRAEEENKKVEILLDEMLREAPVGCNGLILQPYWGPGLKTPEAKGCVIGFTDAVTKEVFYRAIVEGIGYGLLDGLDNLKMRAKREITALSLSGGGSQSDIVCQIMADIFGLPMYRVQTYETSGLGSAMVSFVGVGVFENIPQAVENMCHKTDEFLPNMENHAIYSRYYKIYKKIYKCVKPLYDELYKTLGEDKK
ncbi:MAG: FGGY-family carbohydrate kinase [Clostridia bacterium]